ncbi:DUF7269 family protein [Natronosalvus rutilus]|uniref:Uncharacterized protein n=1 Tax=Natronosalvus rutilus TaxID=2953753 RepID=A0A9E7N8X7_9EURY|nr:hypothetical protein [Natronosalvus rutilus]UTF53031.1 hypothetical protein NGM29_14810 [Natronosalvus rutilus]
MKRTILIALGAGALLATLLATTGVVVLPPASAAIARDVVVLGGGGVAIVLGAMVLVSTVAGAGAHSRLGGPTDDSVSVDRIGDDVEHALERQSLGDDRAERVRRRRARNRVRIAVTDAVMTTLIDSGYDAEEARELVRSGTWTDDPRAAAYLSDAVTLSNRTRLQDWLVGRREQRQAQAAVTELVALRESPLEGRFDESMAGIGSDALEDRELDREEPGRQRRRARS